MKSIVPFIEGNTALELGHGPGHLQSALRVQGLLMFFAIDESPQMGRMAKKRIGRDHKLVRGLAQSLPFPDAAFDTVISTFPTEYIFQGDTLLEAGRVLKKKGRLVVLPFAWPKSRILKRLFELTGESPKALDEEVRSGLIQPFISAGFATELVRVEVKSSMLLIVLARKE